MTNQIERFITAAEAIATALTAIASSNGPVAPATPVTLVATETKTADPSAAKPTAAEKAAAKAAKAAEDKAVAEAAAAAAAKAAAAAAEPEFVYDTLKKAIIELASSGPEGKDAALAILTDAGLAKGQKASDADAKLWPGMHEAAVAALNEIKEAQQFG